MLTYAQYYNGLGSSYAPQQAPTNPYEQMMKRRQNGMGGMFCSVFQNTQQNTQGTANVPYMGGIDTPINQAISDAEKLRYPAPDGMPRYGFDDPNVKAIRDAAQLRQQKRTLPPSVAYSNYQAPQAPQYPYLKYMTF